MAAIDGMSHVTIAIPTYRRGAILVATIEQLLALPQRAAEIVIVDQTPSHPPEIAARLDAWSRSGDIRLVTLSEPSIPHAMNEALRVATQPIVLFLDDDIEPSPQLVAEHERAHGGGICAVVGQVLQPGESPQHFDEAELRRGALRDLEFRFSHDAACDVENVMAGNLSVVRERAIAIGGFDENFSGAAYRFESDFARRMIASGCRIRYAPAASIRHLKLATGGTRAHGNPLTTASPSHSAGEYYFGLLHVRAFGGYALHRFLAVTATRYLLLHPWLIPVRVVAELRGFLEARRLVRGGRKLMSRVE